MVDYDNFCKRCSHKEFNMSQGVLCGITHAKPDFADECKDFSPKEVTNRQMARTAEGRTTTENEKENPKYILFGGITMMVVAIIWFIAGYAAGYIFYYPPVLFVFGLIALVKGFILIAKRDF